jgi:N-acetylglucosamine-6-phosphate deacetylase
MSLTSAAGEKVADRILFRNARILTPYRIMEGSSLLVEDGRIAWIRAGTPRVDGCLEVDAGGNYLSPGFIDLHTHGGGGHDFMDGTVEAFLGAAELHARHGTTSMLPTTLTSTVGELKKTFGVFREAKKANGAGSNLLGLHLEGPYFSMEQRGAQDPRFIRNPDPAEYGEILGWSDDILRWSAAPELEGALEFGRCLRDRGILASIAHTDAIYEQVQEAFENGFTHITHLYSGMSGVRRINAFRYAGVIESAFIIDGMTVEIIADGVHLPASLLRMVYKIKGAGKIALVTDSMRAAGMDGGEFILGSLETGQRVIVEDGVAKLPDRSAFAGSVATADRLVRTMIREAGVPLTDAVRMMTSTPASIIGLERTKGCIAQGMDADLVLFDPDIGIKLTMVGGRIVHEAKFAPLKRTGV